MKPYDNNNYYFTTNLDLASKHYYITLYDGSYLFKTELGAELIDAETVYSHSEMKAEKAIRDAGRPL